MKRDTRILVRQIEQRERDPLNDIIMMWTIGVSTAEMIQSSSELVPLLTASNNKGSGCRAGASRATTAEEREQWGKSDRGKLAYTRCPIAYSGHAPEKCNR